MKKSAIMMITLLSLAAGCRKKVKEVDSTLYIKTQGGESASKPKSLFVDDVDAFVLEDESDPFSGDGFNAVAVDLVPLEDDAKKAQNQAYFSFKTIYFDYDSDKLRPDQKTTVELDLVKVKEATSKGLKVVIEGHACKFGGSTQYNMMLSERRAESVKRYFVEHGVPAKNIIIVGRGDVMCVVGSGDLEAQAPNRRVEIYLHVA